MLKDIQKLFKHLDENQQNVLKVAIIAFITLVIVSVVFSSLNTRRAGYPTMSPGVSIYNSTEYGEKYGYGGVAYDSSYSEGVMGIPSLSIRNFLPIPPQGGTTGNNAEEFEVTDYNASIETRTVDDTCGEVSSWKAKSYVIFENSNEYDRGCGYTFKVERAHVAEILNALKALNPKELSENTYTIKQQVEDFTSEIEILQKKLTSIDETLKNAVAAYNSVTALATKVQDVESLAKIIDSKIQLINRLTQERLQVNQELDRLTRAKNQQLDRIEYTYFRVNVYENKYVDFKDLKDSWKNAVKNFIQDINLILQGLTINLLAFVLFVLQYVVYLLIVLLVVKYGWKLAKYIWEK